MDSWSKNLALDMTRGRGIHSWGKTLAVEMTRGRGIHSWSRTLAVEMTRGRGLHCWPMGDISGPPWSLESKFLKWVRTCGVPPLPNGSTGFRQPLGHTRWCARKVHGGPAGGKEASFLADDGRTSSHAAMLTWGLLSVQNVVK